MLCDASWAESLYGINFLLNRGYITQAIPNNNRKREK
ncbi:MAG: protein of unknown function DUF434 [Podoviridae sp. ctDWo9]|nr:MAG: protein of unknown function DUF434 [Podoviridae sp. ctDWo9]